MIQKKGIDLKEIPALLRSLLDSNSTLPVAEKYASPNPNKNYLIGILPNFFQDKELFKSRTDLSDFAEKVLKIKVTRVDKRSEYELIGLIICEVNNLNDSDLTSLVEVLFKITGSKEKLKQIKDAKRKANFSWNEAIKTLGAV